MILVILDRDGTIITNDDFFGKNDNWKDEIEFNEELIRFLKCIDEEYKTKKIIITNQSGVARGFFTGKRVEDINDFVCSHLKNNEIVIDNCQYCPHVDLKYAKTSGHEFNEKYILDGNRRKPSKQMVLDSLKALKLNLKDFDSVFVLGDRTEDEQLANNLNAKFIDVKNKTADDLMKEFESR